MVELMEPRAKEQGISLDYVNKDLKQIQADPRQMEEIFNNLITNAINYSPDGGKVEISAKTLGENLEIKVSDTGIGIAPEELPKIFDKFYRVKSPKTRQIIGTGLGLSIVKGIVESHRGRIDVESELDKGTSFRILLPIIKD
jgi:two-component system phosphate regulon sensor histidine kinase PhoR